MIMLLMALFLVTLHSVAYSQEKYPAKPVSLIMILSGPKGTPPEVIRAWEEALKVVLKKPEIMGALDQLNFDVDLQFGPDRLKKMLDTERDMLVKIVKERGIKP